MNRYLRDFRNCFKSVNPNLFQIQALNATEELYPQIAENNFTSVIKRHFENLMELPENVELYNGLECHMDIFKGRLGEPIRPDFVLHAGQDNQNRQEIYAEVKLKYNSVMELNEDLEKLERAISNEFRFKYGVMVIVNKRLGEVKRNILNFIDNRFNDSDLRKLYLFHAIQNSENFTANYTIENFLKIKNIWQTYKES